MDEETIVDTINPIVDDYAALRDLVNRAEKFEETAKKYEEKGQPTDIAKINAKRELELRLNYDEVVKFREYERSQRNYDEDDAWLNDTIPDNEKPTEDDTDGIPLPEDDNDFAEENNETTQETTNENTGAVYDVYDNKLLNVIEKEYKQLDANLTDIDSYDAGQYVYTTKEILRGTITSEIDLNEFKALYEAYQTSSEVATVADYNYALLKHCG